MKIKQNKGINLKVENLRFHFFYYNNFELLYFTSFSQGRQGNQKTQQTFFIFFLLKQSGNIRPYQCKIIKYSFHFAFKQPLKTVFYFIKKLNIFYPKLPYPPCPKFIFTYFHLFSSVYGFPQYTLECFFLYLQAN